jgi:hypothetical protein
MADEENTEVSQTEDTGDISSSSSATETSQTENTQGGEQHLEQSGDWWNADSYNVPDTVKPVLQETLKKAQGNMDRVINEKLEAGKKQYSFNNAAELKDMLENDKNLAYQIQQIKEAEDRTTETAESGGFDRMDWAIGNWDRFTPDQKQAYVDSLSKEQYQIFKMGYENTLRNRSETAGYYRNIDESNTKKYGDSYKGMTDQISQFLQSKPGNPREIAYRNLNYENYGKEMYNKGLKERGKLTSGLQ